MYFFLIFQFQDKRISRQYGYSQRGTRASVQNHCYSRWGPRYNAVSAISSEGLIALELLGDGERFVTDTFETFLRNKLLPVMNAFNGQNPRSVIVMGKLTNPKHYHGNFSLYSVFFHSIPYSRILFVFVRQPPCTSCSRNSRLDLQLRGYCPIFATIQSRLESHRGMFCRGKALSQAKRFGLPKSHEPRATYLGCLWPLIIGFLQGIHAACRIFVRNSPA